METALLKLVPGTDTFHGQIWKADILGNILVYDSACCTSVRGHLEKRLNICSTIVGL